MSRSAEHRKELLKRAVDTHTHSVPDICPRSVSGIEAARNTKAGGITA